MPWTRFKKTLNQEMLWLRTLRPRIEVHSYGRIAHVRESVNVSLGKITDATGEYFVRRTVIHYLKTIQFHLENDPVGVLDEGGGWRTDWRLRQLPIVGHDPLGDKEGGVQ